jgi:hypothetical protein
MDMRNENQSRVYKVTFSNGDTHYGRQSMANICSAKSYLSGMASRPASNAKNPIRINMTTWVEKRIADELETTVCEVVFEGPTADAIRVKDSLAAEDTKSLNLRTGVLAGATSSPIKVPAKQSKALKNVDGVVLNFISNNYARIHNLVQYLDETKRHPVDKAYAQILIPIERYQ